MKMMRMGMSYVLFAIWRGHYSSWMTKELEKAGFFWSEGYRDKKEKKDTHMLSLWRGRIWEYKQKLSCINLMYISKRSLWLKELKKYSGN